MLPLWAVIVCGAAATVVWIWGTIFARPRALLGRLPLVGELARCALCAGVWVGGALHLYESPLSWSDASPTGHVRLTVEAVAVGSASGVLALLVVLLLHVLDEA